MWLTDPIFSLVWEIRDFFYWLYSESRGIPILRDYVAPIFFQIYLALHKLLTPIAHFGEWIDDISDKIGEGLTWAVIKSAIRSWLPNIEGIAIWFYQWWTNVYGVVTDWWNIARWEVLGWIADLANWTVSQRNSLQASLITLITDVESWTSTQLNNLQASFTTLISGVETWTLTQINSVKSAILAVISDLETWTITEINSVTATISAIFGDLRLWTQTEINTIQATLTTLIDWTALTNWITGWWSDRLLDIQALINTAFIVREPFWAGWQDWRDKVAEFFSDPLGWLESRFTNWFLGAEENGNTGKEV